MNILERLSDLRAGSPGCAAVALTDLSSGIVLCSSTIVKLPQERVDGLATSAMDVLGSGPGAGMVITLNQENAHVFLRGPQDQAEALCAVCSHRADLERFVARAREVLDDIEAVA